jgi:hypothetical protein
MADEHCKTWTDFEEFCNLLDDATDVATDSWRHGHQETKVIHDADGHWLVTYKVHHSEGIEWNGDITGRRCAPHTETVTVWKVVS